MIQIGFMWFLIYVGLYFIAWLLKRLLPQSQHKLIDGFYKYHRNLFLFMILMLSCSIITLWPTNALNTNNISFASPSPISSDGTLEASFYTAAVEYDIDPVILIAIADIETGGTFDNNLIGGSGETSLMQIMPQMLDWCGLEPSPTADDAIHCTAKLIAEDIMPRWYSMNMDEVFSLQRDYIFSAYNAGYPAIDSCRCVPNKGYMNAGIREYLYYMYHTSMYQEDEGILIADMHGIAPFIGKDYQHVDGFGGDLYAPCTGRITFKGLEPWIGPHSNNKRNTMLVFDCLNGDEIVIFHGKYTLVDNNQFVIGSLTPIGFEDAIGNVINNVPHTHLVVK